MSIICQTFVQNAWRSDLCSNCFKSLDDHSDSKGMKHDRISTHRYMPQATSLYQSRGISSTLKWRLSEPIYERVARRDFASQTPPKSETKTNQNEEQTTGKGILVKNSDRKLRSRSSVDFASEEALVIGYGGNDYDSDLSPWEMGSDDGSIDFDLLDDNDEDRKITKQTKNNTEFNSSNYNLLVAENAVKQSKKEDEKRNRINNNHSSVQNNSSQKSPDKSLNITYNNIQNEKKLNHYYYPSSTEALKSYLHSNSNGIQHKPLNNNKEHSKSLENIKIDNCKQESLRFSDEHAKNLLNNEFTPLNTRTYSFVSELNNKNTSSEHSSDSDYSTCRLTAGDSTDSESFQDADESKMEPCPSFLHGNFPKNVHNTTIQDHEKKYDEGSSTSGDVSNLSDDSDAHDSSEVIPYRFKIVRNAKNSPEEICKTSIKENPATSNRQREDSNANNKNVQVRFKESDPDVTRHSTITIVSKGNDNKIPEEPQAVSSLKDDCLRKELDDVVSVSVSSSSSAIKLKQNKTNPNKEHTVYSKSTKNSNTSTTTENTNSKPSSVSNEKSKVPSKSASNNDLRNDCNVTVRKQPRMSNSTNSQFKCVKNENGNAIESKTQNIPLTTKSSFEYDEGTDCEASPDTIAHRQSKLAALALELELARRDSARPNSINIPVTPQTATIPSEIKILPHSVTPTECYPATNKNPIVSGSSNLAPLPDVLQETPAKAKKNRFSLKKLLKRNKDSGTFTPTGKEPNPKAWKKQSFDRSRLSLEIVHPMDMTSDPATSGESTPTDDYSVCNHPGKGLFKAGYNRARSLSALPQVSNDSREQPACSLLDCRKVETLPSRKAGTVAERKKNRPSLVRTPSCSALPNRTQPNTPSNDSSERAPPPKPPPPPKYKAHHPPPPPPPPHQLRAFKPPANSPARPPPPKIPEIKFRNHSSIPEVTENSGGDKEYANLGDIRSQLIPKKPQRPSAVSVSRESETEHKKSPDDPYEVLQATEEEDHYTYLDDNEKKTSTRTSVPTSRLRSEPDCTPCGRPWLNLQSSYSAIAATNYESLAEIISSTVNESPDYLKIAGKSLKLKDFILEDKTPQILLESRILCSAIYKNLEQEKIMLMIIPRKNNTPAPRNQTRYPVLASFSDFVPKDFGIDEKELASIYILQKSHVSSFHTFAEKTSLEESNQQIHLRNYCFVLLQLIHTLKSLQAEGIEEVNFNLEHLILVTTHEEKPPIFVLFPEDKSYLTLGDTVQSRKTLCQAILDTLYHFLNIRNLDQLRNCSVNGEMLAEPVADTFGAIANVLLEEKASSLTQAKGFLEYMLWGPVDVKISDSEKDDVLETILQRWLDLQRAQMVKSTIYQLQSKINSNLYMHIFEEYQLIYLLQASVKSLKTVISKL